MLYTFQRRDSFAVMGYLFALRAMFSVGTYISKSCVSILLGDPLQKSIRKICVADQSLPSISSRSMNKPYVAKRRLQSNKKPSFRIALQNSSPRIFRGDNRNRAQGLTTSLLRNFLVNRLYHPSAVVQGTLLLKRVTWCSSAICIPKIFTPNGKIEWCHLSGSLQHDVWLVNVDLMTTRFFFHYRSGPINFRSAQLLLRKSLLGWSP